VYEIGTDYAVAKIIFGRNVNGFLLTSCLPTLISDLVGHLTNYYFLTDFEVATSVNLTLMLVITTMQESSIVFLLVVYTI
jgi:hypothetical protein